MTGHGHPPRPRLTLRVGIAGHRPDKLPEPYRPVVEAAIARCLRRLHAAAGEVLAAHPWAFAGEAPELRLVSALAEGSDLHGARAALSLGFGLEAVLPLPLESYAKDFTPDGAAALRALSGAAGALMVLGDDAMAEPDDRAARYEAAGRLVLGRSDILIAVWDGKPASGRGGTQRMVEEARRRGVAVLWLEPVAAATGAPGMAARLWSPRDGEDDDGWRDLAVPESAGHAPSPALDGVVRRLLAPPVESRDRMGRREPGAAERLRQLYAERHRTGSRWIAYELLGVIAGRRPARWLGLAYGDLARDRETAWRDYFAPVAGRIGALERELREVLQERFLWADNLALHRSHVYRSAYVLNFALAALAVIAGVIATLDWSGDGLATACIAIELAIILAIVAMTRLGKRHGWHRRWIDYRRLAELLRPARMTALIGLAADLADTADEEADDGARWVAWYVRATLRELGPPDAVVDRDLLERVTSAALDGEIGRPAPEGPMKDGTGEIGYHQRNHRRLAVLDARLDAAGTLSFAATAAVAVGFLAILAGERVWPGLRDLLSGWGSWAGLLAAALPAIGTAFAGIRAQGEFRSFANRSEATLAALSAIHRRLADTGRRPTLESIERDFRAASEAMMGDLRAWRLVYRNRDLTLPG